MGILANKFYARLVPWFVRQGLSISWGSLRRIYAAACSKSYASGQQVTTWTSSTFMVLILVLLPLSLLAQDKKTLTFAVQEYCPFVCLEDTHSGRISGVYVELLEALFIDSQYQLEFKRVPFLRSFREVGKGNIDGLIAIMKNADRAKTMYFAGPVTRSRSCFYTRSDSLWRYSGTESLNEITLGMVRGYLYKGEVGAHILRPDQNRFYISGENAEQRQLKLLMSHRFDAIYESEVIAEYLIRKLGIGDRIVNAGCENNGELDYIAISKLSPEGKAFYDVLMTKLSAADNRTIIEQIFSNYGISPASHTP